MGPVPAKTYSISVLFHRRGEVVGAGGGAGCEGRWGLGAVAAILIWGGRGADSLARG